MSQTLLWVGPILGLGYFFLILFYLKYWKRLPFWEPPPSCEPTIFLSILLPARNEADRIEACLDSLLAQDYPSHLFEIIIIDDHSTDETVDRVQNLSGGEHRVRLLQLKDFSNKRGKKQALSIGVEHASGDHIITTDADCLVPPAWLRQIGSLLESRPLVFVAGPVQFSNNKTLFEAFQALDFLGMMLITGAGFQHGGWLMANGANMAYAKRAFQKVKGYTGNDHIASGDDLFLLHKIAAQFPSEIAFLKNRKVVVETPALLSFRAFIQQRLRWGTKNAAYSGWSITAQLALVFLLCCYLVLSPLLILLFMPSHAWLIWGLSWLLKVFGDWLLLSEACRFFERRGLLRYFLPAQVLHVWYITFLGIAANLVKSYRWKDRQLQ